MTQFIPTVAFVLTNDFGELLLAHSFAQGQGMDAIFILPERLYQLNAHMTQGRVYEYRSTADILSIIDSAIPDIVMLCSGYLFVMNNIFDLSSYRQLYHELNSRSFLLCTTDPWANLWPDLMRNGSALLNVRDKRQRDIQEHFMALREMLKDIPHIYLDPVAGSSAHQAYPFFNPHVVVDQERIAGYRRALGDIAGLEGADELWLFALSEEDYREQCHLTGEDRFHDQLAGILAWAEKCGGRPVCVAPRRCSEQVRVRSRSGAAVFLEHCSLERFMSLVFSATYAFYWNIVSMSVIVRTLNRLPVFFFDMGHMIRLFPAVLERHLNVHPYFQEIAVLDAGHLADRSSLEKLAVHQKEQVYDRFFQTLSSLPAPQEVLRKMLNERAQQVRG